jgi:hypothetical protein
MVDEIISESAGGIIPERRAASPGIGTLPVTPLSEMLSLGQNRSKLRNRDHLAEEAIS